MPALLIKNLPADVHAWLKQEAARNRRSMTQQVIVLFEERIGTRAPDDVVAFGWRNQDPLLGGVPAEARFPAGPLAGGVGLPLIPAAVGAGFAFARPWP